ncbi:MAG TPA: hypothetical protein VMN83_27295 [Albitalea sp.]|nr:hypothetical protein [Albitalea sp.]
MAEITTAPPALRVEHYPPRFSVYSGTRQQIIDAGVLPWGTEFPACDGKLSVRNWKVGDTSFYLISKFESGEACKLERYSDFFELRVFDVRETFSDNLVEIWRQQCSATAAPKRRGRGTRKRW